VRNDDKKGYDTVSEGRGLRGRVSYNPLSPFFKGDLRGYVPFVKGDLTKRGYTIEIV